MKFNNYLWDLYRSAQKAHDKASYYRTDNHESELSCYEAQSDFQEIAEGLVTTESINLYKVLKTFAISEKVTTLKQAEELFLNLVDNGIILESGEDFNVLTKGQSGTNFICHFGGGLEYEEAYQDDIVSHIETITIALHEAYPQFYFPYLFERKFNTLENIFAFFELDLPEIAGKLQKRERSLYYLLINSILQNFRKENRLTPSELNDFLYDFSSKNIESFQMNNDISSKELPQASRVWFVIAFGKGQDATFLDNINSDSTTIWQGKLEMRRGDIVIMYSQSPKSYIHSIWRVLESGYNDPYAYFYSQVKIGHPIKVPPIKFSEISKNEVLSKKSIVKGKFQGATGSTFSLEEYLVIISLIEEKGFDISSLPRLPEVEKSIELNLKNERDVEIKILEPFLIRLGFNQNDWIRQFPVRMGRGQRNYPDYVFGGNPKHGEETAKALVECKYHIDRDATLTDTFKQAKSYALRLQANIFILADKQGIWIFQKNKNEFIREKFVYKNWSELLHPDQLHEISLLIGKEFLRK